MLSVTLTDRAGVPSAVAVPVRAVRGDEAVAGGRDAGGTRDAGRDDAVGAAGRDERAGRGARAGAGAETVRADLAAFLRDVRATGEAGRVDVLPVPGGRPRTVYLVGIGGAEPASAGDLRRAGAALVRAAIGAPSRERRLASWLGHGVEPEALRGLVEASLLASYRFTRASRPEPPSLRELALVVDETARYSDAFARAVVAAEATALARDLANTPSLEKSPAWFARQAERALAGSGVTVRVRDERALAAEGFGGILAVGGGSARPPRLIEARWALRGVRSPHVVLVGKGITFDTGGLSLKPSDAMTTMKTDMAGGATVLAALAAVARLRLPVRVTALAPAAENHVSGSSYRPGDVVRHYGGRTSEVLNTDAEGRLVLADALAYAARRLAPDMLVDVATLTGAMRVALGTRTGGLFATDDTLASDLLRAAEAAGEPMWRMPLADEYLPLLDSDIADAVNAAGNPGAVTAALFLRPFAGGLPWAHLDVAGPARSTADDGEITKGATGYGVRTLLRFVESIAG